VRRTDREIQDPAMIDSILHQCIIGHLATNGQDGYPRIKPLNYIYFAQKIYIHGAQEGEKIDDIRRDPRVCFEVNLPIAYVKASLQNPCGASFLYRSVIIQGRAHLIKDGSEREKAFEQLMKKYQPNENFTNVIPSILQKMGELTALICIIPEKVVGKENLGKNPLRKRVLQLLESNPSLPLILIPE
jgi:nitroimidazol reductase NimA-like FMN-containing flavoprotein (pyridoxamine 5'-phosphate oxidase superfamily)